MSISPIKSVEIQKNFFLIDSVEFFSVIETLFSVRGELNKKSDSTQATTKMMSRKKSANSKKQ